MNEFCKVGARSVKRVHTLTNGGSILLLLVVALDD